MKIIERLKAETPLFFKRLRNIALAVTGVCGAIGAAYSQLPIGITMTIPPGLLKGIGIAALTAATVSQLTREDK